MRVSIVIFPGLGAGPGFSFSLVRALGPLDRTGSGGGPADSFYAFLLEDSQ